MSTYPKMSKKKMKKEEKKDVKYSFLGELLLGISDTITNNIVLSKTITDYKKRTPKKEVIKDIVFVGSFVAMLLFMGFIVQNIDHLVVPKFQDQLTGVTVSGNCSFIYEEFKRVQSTRRDNTYRIPGGNKVDYIVPTIPVPTTTTTTAPTTSTVRTTTTLCPPCTCEVCTQNACPEIDPDTDCPDKLTNKDNKWLLNLHAKNGATCYQSGYSDCADNVREYLQVPGRPKFKSRPSSADLSQISGVKQGVDDTLFCFPNNKGGFIINRTTYTYTNELGVKINRSMWGWNDNSCRSSVIKINKL